VRKSAKIRDDDNLERRQFHFAEGRLVGSTHSGVSFVSFIRLDSSIFSREGDRRRVMGGGEA
jgi:hypothetical protein